MIKQINNKEEKQKIIKLILEDLHEWFEISQSIEEYIKKCVNQVVIADFEDNSPVGFLCFKETSKDTIEIKVMGVLKKYQRKNIGKALVQKAKEIATSQGYSFIQVKTVKMGKYEEYDKTNLFYLNIGFKELEVIDSIWNEDNPCQIYIMAI